MSANTSATPSVRFDPQRVRRRTLDAAVIVGREIGRWRRTTEQAPDAGFGVPSILRRRGAIHIAEAERLAGVRIVVALLDREADHVLRIQAVVRIVQRELADAGLVRVGCDHAVGHADRDPDQRASGGPETDQLHDPNLIAVADRDGLAGVAVAVLGGEVGHDADRLAGGLGPLESQPHEVVVAQQPVGVL